MANPVALVTGGGGAIGRAVVVHLAKLGFTLAVNDIDAETAHRTVALVEQAGTHALPFVGDVGDAAQVDVMLDDVLRRLGSVAVLVNNAGNPVRFSLIVDMSDAQWAATRRVHMDGPFFLLRGAARQMLRRRSGRIVNIASIAGLRGAVGSAEYGAAKAALINLTRTAARELGPCGITVNAIAPGMVATPANQALQDKGSSFIQAAIDSMPTARLVNPEHIAAMVAFLVGEAGASVNGAVLVADGGASTSSPVDAVMHSHLARRSPFLNAGPSFEDTASCKS